MTEEERAKLLRKIDRRIRQTQEDLDSLREVTKPVGPENAIGRLSRMDAINNKSVNEASLRSAEARMAALQKARQNIDTPDYGRCRKCGQPIGMGRLMLMPESEDCVKCAAR